MKLKHTMFFFHLECFTLVWFYWLLRWFIVKYKLMTSEVCTRSCFQTEYRSHNWTYKRQSLPTTNITAGPDWSSCVSVLFLEEHVEGPVSLSDKTSYRKISWSIEAARFVFSIVRSLRNLTGISAGVLPRRLSNFKAIRWFTLSTSRLRDFTRSQDKTSYRILKQGSGD